MQDRQAPEHTGGGYEEIPDRKASGPEKALEGLPSWLVDICLHLGLRENDSCVKCGDPSKSLEHKRNHVKCIAKCFLCQTRDHPDSMCPRMREPVFRDFFNDDWFLCRLDMSGFPVAKTKGNPEPPKGAPTGPRKMMPDQTRGGLGKSGSRDGRGRGRGYSSAGDNARYWQDRPSSYGQLPLGQSRHAPSWEQDRKRKRAEEEEVVEVVGAMQAQERRAENARRDWEEFSRKTNMAERRMHEEEAKLEEMKAKREEIAKYPTGRMNAKSQIKRLRKHEFAGEAGRHVDLMDLAKAKTEAKAKVDEERKSFPAQKAEIEALKKRLADLEAQQKPSVPEQETLERQLKKSPTPTLPSGTGVKLEPESE